MNRQHRCAGGREIIEVLLGLDDHQMDVQGKRSQLAHSLYYLRTEGKVRHEAPVHDVNVDPVRACFRDHRDLVAQPREVGAQNRRRDSDAHGRPETVSVTRLPAPTARPTAGLCAITVPPAARLVESTLTSPIRS